MELNTPKMSHEEIIDTLKGLVFGTFDRTTVKEREALDMAITLLEQNPCKDTISRQAAIEEIRNLKISVAGKDIFQNEAKETIIKTLDELPSVQPELNCKNCVFRMGYGTGIDEGVLNALPKKMKEGE